MHLLFRKTCLKDMVKLCHMQLNVFERIWNDGIIASQKEKETFSHDDYQRTGTINVKFKELNNDIREYLSKLDVLD